MGRTGARGGSGLPAAGKSTLAVALARRLGAVHRSIDVAEEALLSAGLPADWSLPDRGRRR